jgi:quercetin dioxygenase-like cupin family protein
MNFQALTLAEQLALLPDPDSGGRRYREPFTRGRVRFGVYAPQPHDPQQPHAQDEIYIVARGSAVMSQAGTRTPCRSGDALFVAAGHVHRFEEISDDFAAWVLFFDGPDGTPAA